MQSNTSNADTMSFLCTSELPSLAITPYVGSYAGPHAEHGSHRLAPTGQAICRVVRPDFFYLGLWPGPLFERNGCNSTKGGVHAPDPIL